MQYDRSELGRRYDLPYRGGRAAGARYGDSDFQDHSPDWRARVPGRYRGPGGANPTWFGGYGGQGEEAAYMRYYRGPRPNEQRGRGRRASYGAEYGPHYRPDPGHEDAWNYGGYGGFYRQWGRDDTQGRRLSRGDRL